MIGLKTVKGTKQLKLDPTIYDALQKEKVCCCTCVFGEALTHSFAGPGRRRYLHRGQQWVREARGPV